MNLNLKAGNYCNQCEKESRFIVEWYGVNQDGENPETIADVSSCRDFRHLVYVSREPYSDLGNPDKVTDANSDLEYNLLKGLLIKGLEINKSADSEKLESICEQGQEYINREVLLPNQLELFDN